MGERPYVDEKVRACTTAGLIVERSDNGQKILTLTGQAPLVRYPDGEIRDYSPGLEPARERLERDNARLRSEQFDIRKNCPEHRARTQRTAVSGAAGIHARARLHEAVSNSEA